MALDIESPKVDSDPLQPEDFIALLVEQLMITPSTELSLDMEFIRDLEFDSLQMMEAVDLVSGLIDGNGPAASEAEIVDALQSVRSAYSFYLTRISMPKSALDGGDANRSGLVGRRVALRPPFGVHYSRLYEIAISDEIAWRWRYGGSIPSYDEFLRTFSSGVLTQMVVTRRDEEVALGLVVAYQASLQNRTAHLAAVMAPELVGTGMGVEAVVLFVRHIFEVFDFKKLYMEVPEYNESQFYTGKGRFFQIEGCLKEHSYYNGRRWDQIICAIYKEDLQDIGIL